MKTKTELPVIQHWDASRVSAYKDALKALLKNKSETKEPALLASLERFYD
jgi:hypothetical protein